MVSKEVEEGKIYAFLGVFLTIIGFVIVLLTKKENKYAVYYGKQGLVLGIAWIIVWVVSIILAFIPFLGWLLMVLLYLCMFILWIVGIVYSLSGEMKPIPVIGHFAEKFKV